jgi:release factor glutamine methyltransferase
LKNDEYPPSEDTFFIANNIENEKGNYALDIGSGSGYLTKLLCKNFSLVVGTDINCEVLQHQTSYKTKNLICCNDGGEEGFEIPKKIFDSVISSMTENGKFIFVTSSLSNYQKLIDYAQKLGLKTRIMAKKKLFFEELILVETTK